ncbi:AraC family transcriptional regulator [Vibrio campbellii]|nr:AraC family transcriptional regulator [Vibrio campbellii]ARR08038.1 AraC family transcriptional regulator [Vibrio campbellii]
MEYRYIEMFKPVKLEEFYVEYHYIVNIAFAKGTVYINEQQITIDGPATLIIPQFTCLSCNLTQKSSFSPLQIQLLIVTDEMLEGSLLQLPQKRSFIKNTVAHQLPTPVDVDNNFQLLKEVYDSLSRDALKIMFLEQTLYFILLSLCESGIDVFNVFQFNYEESKREVIARMITKEPQRKWQIQDVAKQLFTSTSTLRRHLQKENLSFSQLLVDVRMGLALNMLTFTSYNVSQISNRCGFGSAAYFCDAFKRKYHLTPSQFRAQSKKTSDASLVSTRSSEVS